MASPGGPGIIPYCNEEHCPGISGPGHTNDSMGDPPWAAMLLGPWGSPGLGVISGKTSGMGGVEAAGGPGAGDPIAHIHSGMEFRF